MRGKRAVAIGVAAATVALMMTGCSSKSGSDSSGSGSKTLTYWASNQGTSIANDKEVLAPELKKFQQQTGIKVNLEVIGWNNLYTRITNAVSSGSGPDVLNIGNTWAPTLQATGAFVPFDAKNMAAIGGSAKFVKSALATGGASGQTVTSVPVYGLAYGLYYNKAMFKSAGLTPPSTWEDMVADAKKLTKGSVHGFGLEAGSVTENVHFAFITALQNGATLYNGTKPNFATSQVVDGVQRYLSLMSSGLVDKSNAQYSTGTEASADFAKGKVAMIINQNNADATLTANGMDASKYGVVPIPAPKGGQPVASGVQGINLSIFKNTKNLSGALKFVKFMTSPAQQAYFGKPYASIPVLVGQKATFSTDPEITATFTKVYDTMAKPYPLVPSEGAFETNVGTAMNGLFAQIATKGSVSRSDVQTALTTAQQKTAAAG
jgi:multiple sugar transport system substrate-binding protein